MFFLLPRWLYGRREHFISPLNIAPNSVLWGWDTEGSCFHPNKWKRKKKLFLLWRFGLCLVVSTNTFHFFHFVFVTRVNCAVRHHMTLIIPHANGPGPCHRPSVSAFVRSHFFPSTWICIFCSRLCLWCTRRRLALFVHWQNVIMGRCGLFAVSGWNPKKIPSSHLDSAPMTPTTTFSSFQQSFPVDAQRECARSCNCSAHITQTYNVTARRCCGVKRRLRLQFLMHCLASHLKHKMNDGAERKKCVSFRSALGDTKYHACNLKRNPKRARNKRKFHCVVATAAALFAFERYLWSILFLRCVVSSCSVRFFFIWQCNSKHSQRSVQNVHNLFSWISFNFFLYFSVAADQLCATGADFGRFSLHNKASGNAEYLNIKLYQILALQCQECSNKQKWLSIIYYISFQFSKFPKMDIEHNNCDG